MSARVQPAQLCWPIARIGEAVIALARRAGLLSAAAVAPRHPPTDDAALDRWLVATGEQLGVDIEAVIATHRDVDAALAGMHPALVRLPDGVLAVVGQRRGALICLAPDGLLHRTPAAAVAAVLQESQGAPQRAKIAGLLAQAPLSDDARARAAAGLLDQFLATTVVLHGWLVRLPPSARFTTQLRTAGVFRVIAGLLVAHGAQYALFLASWWAIGKAVLQGRLSPGWLAGWALILLCTVPLVMLSTSYQGKLAVAIGVLLRRRLLAGALALPPDVLNRDGVGRLLGRTIEAESLEQLALGGGFASALALLELAFVLPVLALGAGGLAHAALLAAWLVITAALAARLARARHRWTDERLALTGLTVEHIVGHRTRLAQELPDRWHDSEDEALSRYLDSSDELDRKTLALVVVVPRGWLLAGLAALAPVFIAGADLIALGTSVGGVVLAWMSLARLGNGFDQLATARVAWRRVAPLFHAAGRDAGGLPLGRPTAPEYVVAPPPVGTEPVLEAIDVTFHHSRRPAPVLSGADLVIRPGERVLVQGASGSGKSTLVSVLTGMQSVTGGLVLARGLDMRALGEIGWRARVAAAPQFHQNHVLTETFAFNLLMSRNWPPRAADVDEARAVCKELGLGPLLDRMPGGMYQIIGETGWQLSHGEKSRLFIARALLQHSDVIILDESLAALDPDNMGQALRCLRARAPSLIVIAHP